MTKQETYDYLRAHGVDFEITEHPAVFNMEECAAVDMPYPEDDAKNLLVRDDKKRSYYLITVRCGKRVDLKEFQRRHGTRRLSFASPEELLRLLDLTPGSVTPLGLKMKRVSPSGVSGMRMAEPMTTSWAMIFPPCWWTRSTTWDKGAIHSSSSMRI